MNLKRNLSALTSLALALLAAPCNAAQQPGTVDPLSCDLKTYPLEALRREQAGTVNLSLRVDADGTVREGTVTQTSLYPRLDSLTLAAAMRCKVAPPERAGKPIAGWVQTGRVWTLEGEASPVSVHPEFANAPAAFRTWLAQARAAATIIDPLKRCRAWPDYPGSAWLPEVVSAHCELAAERGITLKNALEQLQKGEQALLEASLQQHLDSHFGLESVRSEVIHADFGADVFDGSAQSEEVSALWLTRSPRSAFALAARGHHLLERASQSMDDAGLSADDARDIPDIRNGLHEARVLLEQSVALEPRLLPAWGALMKLFVLAGDERRSELAFARTQALDAGCYRVAQRRLVLLSARWRGSMKAKQDFADALKKLASSRPLLATLVHAPAVEKAFALALSNKNEAIVMLRRVALAVPSAETLNMLGLLDTIDTPQEALIALSAGGRFEPGLPGHMSGRGDLLIRAGEFSWAVPGLEEAMRREPVDATRLLLGQALARSGEWELAEVHLRPEFSEGTTQRMAQELLIEVLAHQDKWEDANTVSMAFSARYPDVMMGWLWRGTVLDGLGKRDEADQTFAAMRAVLRKRGGPSMRGKLEWLDAYLSGRRARWKPPVKGD